MDQLGVVYKTSPRGFGQMCDVHLVSVEVVGFGIAVDKVRLEPETGLGEKAADQPILILGTRIHGRIDLKQLEGVPYYVSGQNNAADHPRALIRQLGGWRKSHEEVDFIFVPFLVLADQGIEHLSCALRMANVGDLFLFGNISY